MIHFLTILYLVILSTETFSKTVNLGEEEFPRYPYSTTIEDLNTKDDLTQLDPNLFNVMQPYGNLGLVEYNGGDSSALNAIVQKLASSLQPYPLFGPLPLPLPPINPLIDPLNYGIGASLPTAPSEVTVTGTSIPWDSKTRSYGGWVPLRGPLRKIPMASIVTRTYVNGQLYKVKSKPIPLKGKTIIIRRKPTSD